jgi:uncharacterized protein YjiS (DUF1127 family)
MFIAAIIARFNAWVRYRDTMRQLSRLSDRELDDLGITRSEIGQVARFGAAN